MTATATYSAPASHRLQKAAGIAIAYINCEALPLRSLPTALANSPSLPPLTAMIKLIGIASSLGSRVISMEEIRQRGVTATLAEAMAIARTGSAGYGVSLDLDVLDPAEEAGVGSPAPGGLLCSELEQALRQLRDDPKMLAMEIVEYNPQAAELAWKRTMEFLERNLRK